VYDGFLEDAFEVTMNPAPKLDPSRSPPFTKKQGQYLAFIYNYTPPPCCTGTLAAPGVATRASEQTSVPACLTKDPPDPVRPAFEFDLHWGILSAPSGRERNK
jgi:hypothetical protein